MAVEDPLAVSKKDKKGGFPLFLRVIAITTVFTSESLRCAHRTRIAAEMKGQGKISIDITSSCKDVQQYAKLMTEIGTRDIAKKIIENPVYLTASKTVGPECLVPCAVISAVWAEAGLVSKNLLKRFDTMCIKYEGENP